MSKLRAREIFRDTRHTLIALESLESSQSKTGNSCHVFGKIEPVGVVVHGPEGSYALDMSAMPITMEQLRETVPDLDVLLAAVDA